MGRALRCTVRAVAAMSTLVAAVALVAPTVAPGVAGPLSIDESPVAFTATPSSVQAVSRTVTNISDSTVVLGWVGPPGPGPDILPFTWGGTCTGATLDPGESCHVDFGFSPGLAPYTTTRVFDVRFPVVDGPSQDAQWVITSDIGLRLSSTSADFGDVFTGSTPTVTFTVTNVTDAEIVSTGLVHGNLDVNLTGCPTGTALAPGGTCTVSVQVPPTTAAAEGGHSGTGTFAISGRGISFTWSYRIVAPLDILDVSPIDFGTVPTFSHRVRELVVTNIGEIPYRVSEVVPHSMGNHWIGPGAVPDVFSADRCGGVLLAPHASCRVRVELAPLTEGEMDATMTVLGHELEFVGASVTSLRVDPPVVDLGTVTDGQAWTRSIDLINWLPDPTPALSVTDVSGPPGVTLDATGCTGRVLTVRQRCTLVATGTADSSSSVDGTLRFTVGAAGFEIPVRGFHPDLPALDYTADELEIGPVDFDLGTVPLGDTVSRDVTVTNPTGHVNYRAGFTATSTTPGFTTTGSTCRGAALAAHASCTVRLNFTPTDGEPIPSVMLRIGDRFVPVTFHGSVAQVELALDSFDFGVVVLNEPSTPRTVTVTNITSRPLPLGSNAVSVSAAHLRIVVDDRCANRTLEPSESCTALLRFWPTYAGAYEEPLQISVPADISGAFPMFHGTTFEVTASGEGSPTPDDLRSTLATTTKASLGWTWNIETPKWRLRHNGVLTTVKPKHRAGTTTYTFSAAGLKPGSEHCWSVATLVAPNPLSDPTCLVTPTSRPTARALSASKVSLSWTGAVGRYAVRTADGTVFEVPVVRKGSKLTAVLQGLPANTKGCWQIIAIGSSGRSAPSPAACARTRRAPA